MKKILLLIVFIVMLTGCTLDKENVEIDYTTLIDELYGEEIDEENLDTTLSTEWTFDYVIRFKTFSEMMDFEHSMFIYGKVVEERYRNSFSTYLFVEVYQTEFSDERQIIRLAQMNEDSFVSVGGTYVLNLSFIDEIDEYQFSQQADSVFWIISGQVQIPSRFYDELKGKKDIGVFINYIFISKYNR